MLSPSKAVFAMKSAAERILRDGIEGFQDQHRQCSQLCRKLTLELQLTSFIEEEGAHSPTVTVINVCFSAPFHRHSHAPRFPRPSIGARSMQLCAPKVALDPILVFGLSAHAGVVFAGSYGRLEGKVFRVGHMGTQADLSLVQQAMDALRDALNALPK